ncbi:hypothetical protein K432DRAFT_391722 [Lepidopterella palustris CBS 459.81]|uniref:Uncharacterized protein n=1 Tax=Lepidopterella palustris CBS 459.81 TaxID=1314670 RepID=A0A8E2EDH0_9PEZI|nr:hypothetical protein K432DRAFT_391722 [Lepidopterella palustris CBS 459.81]
MGSKMAIDALLGIIFGISTLLVMIAGIRYRDSICNIAVIAIMRRQRSQRNNGLEANRFPAGRINTNYLDWHRQPSPFDLSRVEQLEWQRERDQASDRSAGH